MKCYPMTGSSGSSIHSKNSASQPTRSRITKSSARSKKPSKVSQAAKGESPQAQEKWQAFIDSAREVTTDNETVRAHLFSALEESRIEEAEKISPTDPGECFDYDVKGLMEKIYRDLHNVAAAQASRSAFGGSGGPRWFYGEVSDIDLLLREVSVGVARAIGKSSQLQSASTLTNIIDRISACVCIRPRVPATRRDLGYRRGDDQMLVMRGSSPREVRQAGR